MTTLKTTRRNFLKITGLSTAVSFQLVNQLKPVQAASTEGSSNPNILIIIGDDCTYNDLSLYGGENVATPNIERLSKQGVTFNKAFLSIAMCNPCRTELYTGLYPASSGACWNHSKARTGTKSIVHYLGDLGYRVGLCGKKHVGPPDSFRFKKVRGIEGGCVHPAPEFKLDGVKTFINKDKKQPFCLVTALFEPHAPWTLGKPENFDQKKLKLPPYMADTDATRSDYAKYLAEIEVLDREVGEILEVLEKSGQADNTIVLFTSEQGSQFPSCKWTNWNTGIHTTLLVRWPGKVKPGQRTDALVQFADITPTLVQTAGGDPNKHDFDGSSFLPVLKGDSEKHREYVYFMHNNIPEGPPYPIRAVTDGKYHYIRNLKPEALYIEKHVMGQNKWHDYWPTWVFDTTFNERSRKSVQRYMRRPPEQFYRMDLDPNEMKNLADDSKYAEEKKRLSAELDRWMKQQGDPGAAIDTEEQWKAAKAGKHFKRI